MNRRNLVLACLALALAVPAFADEPATPPPASAPATTPDASAAAAPAAEHVMFAAKDLKWVDAPAGLPRGAKVAVLHGDPSAPGIFAMRIQMPSGYKVMPHFHPADEQVTVISGDLSMGMGDTFDESKSHKMSAGGFSLMPKGSHHFAWSKGGAVLQIHAMGPWGITYINPSDDPRNAKEAAK